MSVYNGMPYLKEAVKSILNQSYKNLEFIIVDDASTDESWRYLKRLRDKRLKLIKNNKNLGLAASLNKALKVTKGDYIVRMDADDISHPNRLEIQLAFMKRNPKVDICGTWAKLINEYGEILNHVKKPLADEQIKKMNRWMPGLIHSTWFARRTIF